MVERVIERPQAYLQTARSTSETRPLVVELTYCEWAMWMLSGVQKIQPKSGNRVAAGFLDILIWCEQARLAVKKETILANIEKCYMTSEPCPKFDVEPKPEAMEVEEKPKE